MRRLPAAILLLASTACLDANTTEPFVATSLGAPAGWFGGATSASFTVGVTEESHSGSRAVFLAGNSGASGFATVGQVVSVDTLRGKRVRWSGWLQTRTLHTNDAGLWIRVDGPQTTLSFDNMTWAAADMNGDHEWRQFSVVVDVPESALGITLGLLMDGSGALIGDDLSLEVVPGSVALTNPSFVPTPISVDSATVAANYANALPAPVNLDFEAGALPREETIAWLKSHSVSLTALSETSTETELDPFTAMVGDAQVVGLGEATHGTSEFFSLKDRLIRHLVTKMGFTRFGIEATAPEAEEVNRYVLGETDTPADTLIDDLYFWTVDAQEVLTMVEWMRAYNATVAPAQRVQFFGFDMQYPGAAIDSVETFINRVDAARATYVESRIDCIRPYRNDGYRILTSRAIYAAKGAAEKEACATALAEVHDLIAQTAAYKSAEPDHYESVLHSARMIQQFETMIAPQNSYTSSLARDQAMAENAEWIKDQGGPDTKIVLWAHNGHVIKSAGFMGGYLKQTYGSGYVNVGFTFGTGSFNAVGGTQNRLSAWNITFITDGSLEQYFSEANKPVALFDARQIPSGGSGAVQLGQPLMMRSVGSTYVQSQASNFFQTVVLPRDFDVIAWVAVAKASALMR